MDDVEFNLRIREVATSIVQGWQELSHGDIKISALSGGITNTLYVLENIQRNQKVLVRLFGVGTDLFIDRGIENQVFAHLSNNGMGPTFHGLFENGRIEGFLAARNLIPNEFSEPKIMIGVARTMAKLHALTISLSRESSIWSKTSHILSLLSGEMSLLLRIPH